MHATRWPCNLCASQRVPHHQPFMPLPARVDHAACGLSVVEACPPDSYPSLRWWHAALLPYIVPTQHEREAHPGAPPPQLPTPPLHHRYDDAIQHAVVNIGLALAGKEIVPDGPDDDSGSSAVVCAILVLFVAFLVFAAWQANQQATRYKVGSSRGWWGRGRPRLPSCPTAPQSHVALVGHHRPRRQLQRSLLRSPQASAPVGCGAGPAGILHPTPGPVPFPFTAPTPHPKPWRMRLTSLQASCTLKGFRATPLHPLATTSLHHLPAEVQLPPGPHQERPGSAAGGRVHRAVLPHLPGGLPDARRAAGLQRTGAIRAGEAGVECSQG